MESTAAPSVKGRPREFCVDAALGKALRGWEASDFEQATAELRARLGREVWETAWEEGRTMPREEVIAFALDDAAG